ncbi:MAG: dockerin type I repeat-containing protein [Clostridia bacterium]|nr:dockerin type I repeat-containing protein [Clostridia bacterium]
MYPGKDAKNSKYIKKYARKAVAALLCAVLCFSVAFPAGAGDLNIDFNELRAVFGQKDQNGNRDYLRMLFYTINLLSKGGSSDSDGSGSVYTDRSRGSIEVPAEQLAQYAQFAETFNGAVNRIKTERPHFTLTSRTGLPASGGLDIDKNGIITEFNNIAIIVGAVTGILFGADNVFDITKIPEYIGINELFADPTTEVFQRGQDCRGAVSVSGEDYVAALRAEDIYKVEYTKSRQGGYLMRLYLYDCKAPKAKTDAQGRVFDLFSDTKLYTTIRSFAPNLTPEMVSIKYVDCYAECKVDRYGNVTAYTTHYRCVVSFDKELAMVSGVDISEYMSLQDTVIYERLDRFTDFNWGERKIGDANDDDEINAADARPILRYAASLDEVPDGTAKFADVDGDGKINAIDARYVLRYAAKLDELPAAAAPTQAPTSEATTTEPKLVEPTEPAGTEPATAPPPTEPAPATTVPDATEPGETTDFAPNPFAVG